MIKLEKSHVPVAASTHAGMSGKNNEDSFRVSAYQMSEHNAMRVLAAVLCDGVGGHQAGEVASTMGINIITDTIAGANGEDLTNVLTAAIEKASVEINKQSAQNAEGPGRAGMGSTASIACLMGNRLYTATVGDSRIYLLRGGKIQQISKDHTWIQDALDIGLITPDQVHGHPNSHVIRRYMGGPGIPEVDLRMFLTGDETDEQAIGNQGTRLQEGDTVLLCSDGLTDLVTAQEIQETISRHGEQMQQALQELTKMANNRGGHDNITMILFRVPANVGIPGTSPEKLESSPSAKSTANPAKTGKGCLGMLLVPFIALAAVIPFIIAN